jgi:hypothetical protein
VASRKVDPRGTGFRAMSYEQHATFLEKTVREIGMTHQGATSYELDEGISDPQGDIEVAGVNRESPIHIRDSPEGQTTPRDGRTLVPTNSVANKMNAG